MNVRTAAEQPDVPAARTISPSPPAPTSISDGTAISSSSSSTATAISTAQPLHHLHHYQLPPLPPPPPSSALTSTPAVAAVAPWSPSRLPPSASSDPLSARADAKPSLPPSPAPASITSLTKPDLNGDIYCSSNPGPTSREVYRSHQSAVPPYHPTTHPTTDPQHKRTSPADTHDDVSSSGPPKKRRRPALSCEPCRKRKVKCDRLQPCGPCVRMGHASACEYDNRFPRAGVSGTFEFSSAPHTPVYHSVTSSQSQPSPAPASVAASSYDFAADLRNHTYMPTTAHHPSLLSNGAASTAVPQVSVPDTVPNLSYAVRDLQDRLFRVESGAREANGKTSHQANAALQESIDVLSTRIQDLQRRLSNAKQFDSTPEQKTDLSVPLPAPRTRTDGSTVKFWGPTHYMHLFDSKTDFFGQVLANRSRSKFDVSHNSQTSTSVDLFNRARALRSNIKERKLHHTLQPKTLPQVLQSLPPWDVRDQLVGHYLRTFELVYRVFHTPTLRQLYDTHFRNLDAAPVALQMQLLLIFSIGSVFTDETHRASLLPLVPQWQYAVQEYLGSPVEKHFHSEEWIRVYCLLILVRQVNSIGTKEQNYSLAASMVRTAFTQGLHRDPTYLNITSPFHAEMRRRLWCAVLELALMASFDASMPPLVSEGEYDCQAPINLDDQYLTESAATPPSASPTAVYTEVSIQLLLRQSYPARLEICRMLNDFRNEVSYDRALELSDAIQHACRAANEFFSHHLSRFADWSRPKDLHKHIVETILWSTQLCLHRAFYSASKKDQRFHYSRHMCLEAAQAIVASLGDLDPRSASFDDYGKLVLAGCGTYKSPLSLGASGVIILEVMAQLEEAKAIPSRASPAVCEALVRMLEHVRAQCLQIIKSGDPSCKRYMYLSVSLAMIQAVRAGKEANIVVADTIKESLRDCIYIMREQIEGVPATATNSSAVSDALYSGQDLEFDWSLLENMEFDFDPSWLLTAWDFTSARNRVG